MAMLVYSVIMSLDGYVADEAGNFDWAAPDEELHRFVNDQERAIGTYLYGRRMYETMVFWEGELGEQPRHIHDYGDIWKAADKVVYSRTLEAPSSARTRIEREFDPDAVRAMKESSGRDIGVGGPHLAAQAIGNGLVDELHVYLVPMVVGGVNRAPPDDIRLALELVDERRFAGGAVHLHYRLRT